MSLHSFSETFSLPPSSHSFQWLPCSKEESYHDSTLECGHENLSTRIINGVAAKKGRYPWIASVLVPASSDGSYSLCTGSLINDRYILTAASCIKGPSIDPSKILVSIKTYTQYEYTTNTIPVESFVAHPEFEEFKTNNVGLIKLKEPVQIASTTSTQSGGAPASTETVSPICLPSFDPSDADAESMFAAGFGFTDSSYTQAQQLNEVGVKEIESMKCLEKFKTASGQFLNVKKLLCGESDLKGINQGDFGGPLAVREDGRVYQAGIASYYFTNGATGGKLFDVYERITPHILWIKSKTEDANWCRAPAQAIQPAAKESPSSAKGPTIKPSGGDTKSADNGNVSKDGNVSKVDGTESKAKSESPKSEPQKESLNSNSPGDASKKETFSDTKSSDNKNSNQIADSKSSDPKSTPDSKSVPSTKDGTVTEPDTGPKCECGVESVQKRIVNGMSVTSVKYPWLASIVASNDGRNWDYCGGTLINDKFILTAAHCVDTSQYDVSKFIVTLGAITRKDRFDRPRLDVESITRHPKFDEATFKYDIALIKLKNPLTMNSTVSPACLPKYRKEYDNLFSAGFGFVDDGYDTQGNPKFKQGDELRETNLKNVEMDICMKRWSEQSDIGEVVNEKRNVCAGSESDRFGKNFGQTCTGDSGGPLSTRKNGSVFVVGVTSFGHPDCGVKSKLPDVFESVPFHLEWINEVTKPSNWCSGQGQAITN